PLLLVVLLGGGPDVVGHELADFLQHLLRLLGLFVRHVHTIPHRWVRRRTRIASKVPSMSDMTLVTDGLHFPEGPVALRDGRVVVVEIQSGTITAVSPDGAKEVLA